MGGMAPYVSMARGRSQMYYTQCSAPDMPPNMQRGPCFPDDKLNCGMVGGMGEFKPPIMSNIEPPPPKKKRRTANSVAANQAPPPPVMQDLLPPPLTGYGDTIVASNPFDDSPPQMAPTHVNMNNMNPMNNINSMNNMSHMQQHMRHMPCSPQHMMHMGGPSPCQMGGSPLNCGPPMGSPMSSGPMSCVGGPGGMNCGPGMGSPIGPNRSPLMCPPGGGMMSCGPPASSPMNPSVGSPLMNAMSGPPSGSPMDCGSGMGSTKGSPMTNMNHQQPPSVAAAAVVAAAAGGPAGLNCSSPMGSPMAGCPMGEMGSVLNRSPAAGGLGSPLCSGPSPHMNSSNVNVGSGTTNSGAACPLSSADCPGQKGVSSQQSNNVSVSVSTATVSCGMGVSGVGVVNAVTCGSVTMNGPGNSRLMQTQSSIQQQSQQQQQQQNQQQSHPQQQQQQPPPQQQTPQSQQQQMMNHHPPPHPPGMMGPGMSPVHGIGMHHNYSGPKPMPVSAGKVYPADQPMVFNPQNPNAPPIYPCGICHKEVHDNDQAILCESGCNFWFHRVCTGLIEAAYQLLTAEVYAEWVCDKCLNSKSIPLVKFKP